MSQKEGGEVEMEGEDAMKVDVYKKGSESIIGGIEKRKDRDKKQKKRH